MAQSSSDILGDIENVNESEDTQQRQSWAEGPLEKKQLPGSFEENSNAGADSVSGSLGLL